MIWGISGTEEIMLLDSGVPWRYGSDLNVRSFIEGKERPWISGPTRLSMQVLLRTAVTILVASAFLPPMGQGWAEGFTVRAEKPLWILPAVFEGEALSHAFTLINQGNTPVRIKRVAPA